MNPKSLPAPDPVALSRTLCAGDFDAALAVARGLRERGETPVVVSACLLGAPTRYDGRDRLTPAAVRVLDGRPVLPLCPELLGGMGCPRPPVHFADGDGEALAGGGGRALDDRGRDAGPALLDGARRALALAQAAGAREAILKERSPSCGCRQVHGPAGVMAGRGVFTALARAAGLTCRSDEEI